MTLFAYWKQTVEPITRDWYDKDKAGDVALITLALWLLIPPLSAFAAVCIAAVLYFGIGKVLVADGVISHGGHKSPLYNAVQWVSEITCCTLPIALVYGATHDRRLGMLIAGADLLLYLVFSFLLAILPDT